MRPLKTFLWMVFLGGLVGAIVATWLGPQVLAWWYTPPADQALACRTSVEWAVYHLRAVILWGTAAGTAGGLVMGIGWALRGKTNNHRQRKEPSITSLDHQK